MEARKSLMPIIIHLFLSPIILGVALGISPRRPSEYNVGVVGIIMFTTGAATTGSPPAVDLHLAPAEARAGSHAVVPREWSVANVRSYGVRGCPDG